MKRELHTLYIKHDGQFRTLSKIALAQLILKIIHIKSTGVTIKQLFSEISNILTSPIANEDITKALEILKREKKISLGSNRYYIHNDYKTQLSFEVNKINNLRDSVLNKYFGRAETESKFLHDWFSDVTITFFENYSFEWFHQIATRNKGNISNIPNLERILNSSLTSAKNIQENDKQWLKEQYLKFIDSDDPDDNLMFWYYGISMFSARLITARNYADGLTVEMFKSSKFILDTNVLMILDLEEHELRNSLKSLEAILAQLNISVIYLYSTREEYLRAMEWRKNETIRVFENYTLNVLKSMDCPFVKTALRRQCATGEDIARMFEGLMEMPPKFCEALKVEKFDTAGLDDAIESGSKSEKLLSEINHVYKKRFGREKRELPLKHDAGMINGAKFIRNTENCWIVTIDSTLKRYAIEHCLRNESEIAVGLDVIIGIMAVNSGGAGKDASNFAPLFKNLIKYSLLPESKSFETRDLAFILNTNTRVQELPDERVIEIAQEVKRMRISGEEDETIALYLRRVIEGDKIQFLEDAQAARNMESLQKLQKEQALRERDVAYSEYARKRKGELRDNYDKKLRANRILLVLIPLVTLCLILLTFRYGFADNRPLTLWLIGVAVELIFGILPLFPLNRHISRKYSKYVTEIESVVQAEILEMQRRAA